MSGSASIPAIRPIPVPAAAPAGQPVRGRPAARLTAQDPPFLVFHQWLLIAAGILVAGFVALTSGALAFVVTNDSTFISVGVLALFLVTTGYCGARARRLARELIAAQRMLAGPADDGVATPAIDHDTRDTWFDAYRQAVLADGTPVSGGDGAGGGRAGGVPDRPALLGALQERLRGAHEVGWFITESLTKLGLLGTVLGFLIMMSALVGSSALEISAMQAILRDMAAGMGIKIIATIVGLLCNIVLALQWLLLDRCADKILAAAALLAPAPDAPQ